MTQKLISQKIFANEHGSYLNMININFFLVFKQCHAYFYFKYVRQIAIFMYNVYFDRMGICMETLLTKMQLGKANKSTGQMLLQLDSTQSIRKSCHCTILPVKKHEKRTTSHVSIITLLHRKMRVAMADFPSIQQTTSFVLKQLTNELPF